MKYCKKCVNTDSRPDTGSFKEGLCPACYFHKKTKKQEIDFSERKKEIEEIIQWGKKNTKSHYDCIVTVSGGKDSMRQAFYARDKLGLNPLLVSSVYPPEQLHERGAYNLGNLISHGFDTISMSLNPQVWKKMMRQAFFKSANYGESSELPLYAIPIHVAIAYKIPLIFLGENPLYTIGQQEGKTSGGNAIGMQYSNTLKGGTPNRLMTEDISFRDVYFYCYPSDDEIDYAKLRVIYMGYYIEDWTDQNNAKEAIENGMKVRDDIPENTGDYLGFYALDEEYKIVNQMIKYVKFGFGCVTDQMCTLLREGSINREKAFQLLEKYDGRCHDKYIKMYCDYLEISESKFWEVVESFRGKHVWEKDANDKWKLKVDSIKEK